MSNHTPEPWEFESEPQYCSEIIGSNGDSVCTFVEDPSCVDVDRILSCVNACAGMEDPAAEISELKQQRDELLGALHDAATSLETIQLRSFGADSYLDDKHSMRAYAGARAAVARESIASTKGSAS